MNPLKKFWAGLLTAVLMGATLLLIACQPIEKTARDAIVGAEAFLNQAKVNHPECNPALPPDHPLIVEFGPQADNNICQAIYKAIAAQNVAVEALSFYCSGSPQAGELSFNDGGECIPVRSPDLRKQLQSRLKAALFDLDGIISDLGRLL